MWLPPLRQPKPSQNLVIFDWDDTLFPTSHLNPLGEKEDVFEKHGAQMKEMEDTAVELVGKCLRQSKVAIITNARKGWVELSSSQFMPRLHTLIMKYVKIISARVDFEELYPFDTFKWKELAFAKLWQEEHFLDKAAITNLIAVGDSECEMEAAKIFAC